MSEWKHSEQKEPEHKDQKRFKISYFVYIKNQRTRAYKIVFAYSIENARQKADVYEPLIYDITEI